MGRRKKYSKRLRIPKTIYEEQARVNGAKIVAGADEAGRGAWAGPLVAAAVILPERRITKIRDSKLLTKKERQVLARKVRRIAMSFGIGIVSVLEMNQLGMTKATFRAFRRAVRALKPQPDFLLVDGFRIPQFGISQQAIKKGDMLCSSIAAASIIAKVERDRLMRRLAKDYPQFGFDIHKGYGTKLHQRRLAQFGPCRAHRKIFRPIASLQANHQD